MLVFLLFFGCEKNDPNNCMKSPGVLFSLFVAREGNFSKYPVDDTLDFLINIRKSSVGLKPPVVEVNGHNYSVTTDQEDECTFENHTFGFLNAQRSSYFTYGQNNTLNMEGEVCGTVSETFMTPQELRVPLPTSYVIHRNADFILDLNGIDDFPFPAIAGGNPQEELDDISVNITYIRSLSDTLTYPTLPVDRIIVGTSYQKSNNGKIIVSSNELKKLPLNGTASVAIFRSTQYNLPNMSKGPIWIHFEQSQYAFFTIKD